MNRQDEVKQEIFSLIWEHRETDIGKPALLATWAPPASTPPPPESIK